MAASEFCRKKTKSKYHYMFSWFDFGGILPGLREPQPPEKPHQPPDYRCLMWSLSTIGVPPEYSKEKTFTNPLPEALEGSNAPSNFRGFECLSHRNASATGDSLSGTTARCLKLPKATIRQQ